MSIVKFRVGPKVVIAESKDSMFLVHVKHDDGVHDSIEGLVATKEQAVNLFNWTLRDLGVDCIEVADF